MSRVFVVRYRYEAAESELARLRPARYEFFQDLTRSGVLLASGQLLDGPCDGMLILRAKDADKATRYLDEDPFVLAGVVASRTVESWMASVGAWIDG